MESTYETIQRVNREVHENAVQAVKALVAHRNSISGTPQGEGQAAAQIKRIEAEVLEWLRVELGVKSEAQKKREIQSYNRGMA